MDPKQLNRQRNSDYDKFLTVTNHKAAIFRDSIIESEYDPLEPNRHAIKAQTQRLDDPVKISELKAERESAMLQSGQSRKRSQKTKPVLGKDTLNVELWASGKIEGTPYGSFAKMMNNSSATVSSGEPQQQRRSKTMESHLFFDDFTYPRGNAVVQQEMPRGKRIYPITVYADPGRVFGNLPPEAKRELAEIQLPENRRLSH